MSNITEKTMLPISLILTAMGGIIWLSTLHAKTDENSNRLDKLENTTSKVSDDIHRIAIDTAFIKGEMTKIRQEIR